MSEQDPRKNPRYDKDRGYNTDSASQAAAAVDFLLESTAVNSSLENGQHVDRRSEEFWLSEDTSVIVSRTHWGDLSFDHVRQLSSTFDGGRIIDAFKWDSDDPTDEDTRVAVHQLGEDTFIKPGFSEEDWVLLRTTLDKALLKKVSQDPGVHQLVRNNLLGLVDDENLAAEVTLRISDICEATGLNPRRMNEAWEMAEADIAQEMEAGNG